MNFSWFPSSDWEPGKNLIEEAGTEARPTDMFSNPLPWQPRLLSTGLPCKADAGELVKPRKTLQTATIGLTMILLLPGFTLSRPSAATAADPPPDRVITIAAVAIMME